MKISYLKDILKKLDSPRKQSVREYPEPQKGAISSPPVSPFSYEKGGGGLGYPQGVQGLDYNNSIDKYIDTLIKLIYLAYNIVDNSTKVLNLNNILKSILSQYDPKYYDNYLININYYNDYLDNVLKQYPNNKFNLNFK